MRGRIQDELLHVHLPSLNRCSNLGFRGSGGRITLARSLALAAGISRRAVLSPDKRGRRDIPNPLPELFSPHKFEFLFLFIFCPPPTAALFLFLCFFFFFLYFPLEKHLALGDIPLLNRILFINI